jgi:signal transduction histidine kinase
MVLVLAAQRHDLATGWHAALAWLLVGLAGVVTMSLTTLGVRRPAALLTPGPISIELAVAVALLICDGIVFRHGHIGSNQSSLAGAWPLAGVLTVGVAIGEWAGVASGVAMGFARFASVPLNGVPVSSIRASVSLSILSTFVLFGIAGAVSGYAVRLLRRADNEISRARAHEEVSRTLHDGVLQTLAVVERRASDPQLAAMAREQEQELRAYLAGFVGAGATSPETVRFGRPRNGSRRESIPAGQLEVRLRRDAARFEERFSARVDVVVAADLPALRSEVADALTGAVAEALTNAGKHGGASRVTIFVEPAERGVVFCSVRDNGSGFDAADTVEGLGMTGSIRGRVNGVGGRIEIDGAPGRGAEVRMWV